jgi:transcription-repair coupling factor (superfamily II helicase)
MTGDAVKRLEAIEAAGDLGAGYLLATHDLEIRGAGELLGEEQSGQIHSVGFSLYMDMLQRAVASLRRGEIPNLDAPLDPGTEVNLNVPALIPEDYLPDTNTRLVLYKRIAAADSEKALRDIQVEMIDRFGLLPEQVANLFSQARLRLQADTLGIAGIEVGAQGAAVDFRESTRVNPLSLVRKVQSDPRTYQLAGPTRLKIVADLPDVAKRQQFVEELLADFEADATDDAA